MIGSFLGICASRTASCGTFTADFESCGAAIRPVLGSTGAVVAPAALYFFVKTLYAIRSYADESYADEDEDVSENYPILVLPRDFLHRGPARTKPKKKRK